MEFVLAGAGVTVPVREQLSVFGDARLMIGGAGGNGMYAAAPIRVGLSWRF